MHMQTLTSKMGKQHLKGKSIPSYAVPMSPNEESKRSGIKGPVKKKVPAGSSLGDIFRAQLNSPDFSGVVDLSSSSLNDSNVNQVLLLIKKYASTSQYNVKGINLSKNRFTDMGAIQICKQVSETQVQTLNLAKNKLTERCVESLIAALKSSKYLKVLNVGENSDLVNNKAAKNRLKNGLAIKRIQALL